MRSKSVRILFQILNYGLGGMYNVHVDAVGSEDIHSDSKLNVECFYTIIRFRSVKKWCIVAHVTRQTMVDSRFNSSSTYNYNRLYADV